MNRCLGHGTSSGDCQGGIRNKVLYGKNTKCLWNQILMRPGDIGMALGVRKYKLNRVGEMLLAILSEAGYFNT